MLNKNQNKGRLLIILNYQLKHAVFVFTKIKKRKKRKNNKEHSGRFSRLVVAFIGNDYRRLYLPLLIRDQRSQEGKLVKTKK